MKVKFIISILTLCILFGCIGCSASAPNGSKDDYYAGSAPGLNYEASLPELGYEHEEVKENAFADPAQTPNSTFSLDRNTASYTFARKIINSGGKVSTGAVRIEEYINYFNYDYARPQKGEGLAMGGSLAMCPWNNENFIFTVNVSAEEISFENKVQNNLVFLIDTSGSMYGEDRLGLIQQAFTMLTENLAENDIVSVVTYASGVGIAGEGMLGNEKVKIANVLQDLSAGGSTNGAGGIQLAYEVAQKYFVQGGNNRVILATDGDFNVGISNKDDLNEFISEKRELGIWLSVLGVGMYNTNDTTMKTLAENGNGNYAYLDSVNEARKVLVQEMGGTLVSVAKDVKINVEFNPEVVEKYRLIGYETKTLTLEDFENQQKDAGEIGSGHTVTAVYEIKFKEGDSQGKIASAEIRYKDPSTDESKSLTKDYTTDLNLDVPYSEDLIFIGCVTEFGLLLRNSEYKASASFDSIISRLEQLTCVCGDNADQFKAEFLELVKKAKQNYSKN